MYEAKVTIKNEIGLHARPASLFIQEAIKYSSNIAVIKDEKTYNGKSIMSILSMSAGQGQEITIKATGEDEEEAVNGLINLIENKL
ncbi:HPr family phosphocarrier protein [Helcococcus kunzii]|uniref:Phosphocarrier protein HPr n=1 Tax=Helcococcus kunzii ATCC 51366 TaxID=883114 RepID=H3NNP1_9FIRM|nr:HPr family phosphocarrier protein [Helcococcus kunzii]EHR34016.1 HPr family phosphocarrier [Helcococcus kunzii ATCC 51366]MCT1795624.1 HPr family phosphocarrier protein [Helcococcus kunzii]MCT1988810.1 HPr family phosphocarrier protein [Helcococcus kunzii]QUY64866.1 HPr family phosphocarrier protein [Helcococcus kunzii]QZO77308.1 HPr family phosphocarrier protein [Helcococcus kunzii]